mmetsp:Transcript_70924/g.154084  ORF Transcript_70924/g.154084 Transcript_70924/m.154084 type:complete len:302 (+) Transcript_70924:737-1642(+)
MEPVPSYTCFDLRARVAEVIHNILVCLGSLSILANWSKFFLHLALRDHRKPRQHGVVVLVLTHQLLHILANRCTPLGVRRRPELLVIQNVLSEPGEQLVMRQPKADVKETTASDVRTLLAVDQPPELPAVKAQSEEPVQAAEQGRRQSAAIRHVRLNAVGKLIRLINELLEGLQGEQRLEVGALHDVRLEEAAKAEGLLVSQLERTIPVVPFLGNGPVGLPAGPPSTITPAIVLVTFFALDFFQFVLMFLTELASAFGLFVEVALYFLHLLKLLTLGCLFLFGIIPASVTPARLVTVVLAI